MDHHQQRELLTRIFALLENQSTDMAPVPSRNPVSAYTSAAQCERERARLFRTGPLLAGLSGDIANPGDWCALNMAGTPILLVRDATGQPRAFLNICRHRGMRVASGRGSGTQRFTCPYHSWSYDLEGKLRWRPCAEGFTDNAEEPVGLLALPIAEAYGLLYVRLSPGEPIRIDEVLGGVEQELGGFGLDHHVPVETREYEREINWKLGIESFMEAYHVHHLHGDSLRTVFHDNCAVFDTFGRNCRLIAPRHSLPALHEQPRGDWQLLPHVTFVYCLFPNTIFIYQLDHVELFQTFPDTEKPGRARTRMTLYAPEPVTTESAVRHWKANLDVIERAFVTQDFAAAEEQQRNYTVGLLDEVVFGRNEPGLIHFHEALRSQLDGPA